MIRLLICIFSLIVFTLNTNANDALSIQVNPSAYILGGSSLQINYRSDHLEVGLEYIRLDVPDFADATFFDFNNGDVEDIDVTWDLGIGLNLKYFLKDNGRGFFWAYNIGYEEWDFELNGDFAEADNWFTSVGLGYNYFFNDHFFIQPVFTLIYLFGQEDSYELANGQVEINDLAYNLGITIGWEF